MNDADTAFESAVSSVVQRARRASGVDVAFAGTAEAAPRGLGLVLTALSGARGTALAGLRVPSGLGLGGRVLAAERALVLSDYAAAPDITHDFDAIVVGQERITSVAAVPVRVGGRVRAVIYGATRQGRTVGDEAVRALETAAQQITTGPARTPAQGPRAALDELEQALALASGEMRTRLERVRSLLDGGAPAPAPSLTIRERDVLRHVAAGSTNLEIAVAEGLRPETVKAYLRSAMRKLDVHTRAAACMQASRHGLL